MTDLPTANPAPSSAQAIFARDPLLAAQSTPRSTADQTAARATAEEFEAVFISQMMSHMFAGISTDGPFSGGQAEQVYRSMMVNEYGRLAIASGGLGIADQVMSEILRLQEVPE